MAELHELSSILQNLKDSYDSIVATKSVQSDIVTQLNEVNTSLDSAISAYSSAGSDAQITNLVNSIGIIKGGVSAVISHTQGDLDGLYANLEEVKASVIDRVDELHDQCASEGWKEASTETVKDSKTGEEKQVRKENDQAKIDQANAEIDMLNQKGEAQLNAISAAINGVSFGVIGNMVTGGGVVAGVNYLDNYTFDASQFVIEGTDGETPGEETGDESGEETGDETGEETGEETGDESGDQSDGDKEQQATGTNLASKVVSAVVGTGEGVLQLGEGIVDGAGTVTSWLLGKIGDWTGSEWCKQASKDVESFVKTDYSGMAGDAAMNAVSGLTGGYVQNDEGVRSGANIVGEVGAAVFVPWVGLKAAATSALGQTSETMLGAGANIDQATGAGALAAAGTLVVGKVAQKVAGKLVNTKLGTKLANTKLGQKVATTKIGKAIGMDAVVTTGAATAALAAETATVATEAATPVVAETVGAATPVVAETVGAATPVVAETVGAATPVVAETVGAAAPAAVALGTRVVP